MTSHEEEAANVVVDVPAGLWAAIQAESHEPCEATVSVPGFEPGPVGNDFPWEASGSASYPGPPAILGAGYSIDASSSACGEVRYTEHPEQFVGDDNEDQQTSEQRGNLEVCTGCIVQGCNDLVP